VYENIPTKPNISPTFVYNANRGKNEPIDINKKFSLEKTRIFSAILLVKIWTLPT
jgi:hypothetical protein